MPTSQQEIFLKKYYKALIIIVSLFFALPLSASGGDIRITEIMYDPVGTDSGREWVEVFAPDQEDALSEYYLRENEVNHRISLYEDHPHEENGGYAVIADNPAKFLIDFPDYRGYLYDSAFSLKNTGEILQIVSKDQDILFSYEYIPTEESFDEAFSLQVDSSGEWVVGSPSPGSSEVSPVQTSGEGTSGATSTSADGLEDQVKSSTKKKSLNKLPQKKSLRDMDIKKEVYGFIHTPLYFEPFIGKDFQGLSEKMSWSYGDGTSDFTDKPHHTYRFPGEYLVVGSFKEKEMLEQILYTRVIIKENPVEIIEVNFEGGYVEIKNNSGDLVNIEGFRIPLDHSSYYSFPENTLILGERSLKISFDTLGVFHRGVDFTQIELGAIEYPRATK